MKVLFKTFPHKDKEPCKICKQEVNTYVDKWVALVDFEGEFQEKVAIYHRRCMNDLLKGKAKIIQDNVMKKVQKQAGTIIKNMQGIIGNGRFN